MSDDTPVTATVRIEATPEEVFPYLVDADLLTRWLAQTAVVTAQPGGALAFGMHDGRVLGTYLVVSPPHRVVFTWGREGSDVMPAGSTTVEIYLTADGDATILDLTHRDLPVSQQPLHQEGWGACLAALAGAL